jgi:RNA-directed DNA polymerase
MDHEGIEMKPEMVNSFEGGSGRNSQEPDLGVSKSTAAKEIPNLQECSLMEAVLEKENMLRAYKRVIGNKGSPGVDEMTTVELGAYLKINWPQIKNQLLAGRYQPAPVKGVEIPKPGGNGMRKLGIPTVIDRLIQQALHQILSPIFERGFSENSYGFRPNRSAHQAILKAKEYISQGKRWVVDMDLEKFFDRVNHDILMSRIARKIKDKRVLHLIRRYLQAGLMIGGIETIRTEGTPQGGPLSPLLSNIMLDDLDKELEKRGHAFCRYADDCNIYVKSEEAGKRVMESIRQFLEKKLKLKINEAKSAVARPWKRKFLGYSVLPDKRPRLKPSKEALKKLKDKLKEQIRKGRGKNITRLAQELRPILLGWINYFRLIGVKEALELIDSWLRRKFRDIIWRQKKRWEARKRMLMERIPWISEENANRFAGNGYGPWRNAKASHMNLAYPKKYFDSIGLISLLDRKRELDRELQTAVYGTVRTVV